MAGLPERMMLRGGTFYCRVWVPNDVAPLIGRRIVVTSLRTKDPKIARTRLARKTVELDDVFERARAGSTSAAHAAQTPETDLRAIAREHSSAVVEKAYVDQAILFDRATKDSEQLFSGELTPLPGPADHHDEFARYDSLADEGDLDTVIAYLHRFRLRKRIAQLTRMRATGNLAEFIALAGHHAPELEAGSKVMFARSLLEAELEALKSVADGKPVSEMSPTSSPMAAESQLRTTTEKRLAAADLPSVTLDDLFRRWEEEAEPSASTLSTWRGVVRNLTAYLGPKANDIRSVSSDDIVAWKDELVRSGKSAKTIGNGYLACARVLFRFAIANKLADHDPVEGVKVARKAKAGKKMLGYDNAEVARILELASAAPEPWKRWLPWLAAATGSRIGEVAQLHGSHVLERDGVQVVRIAPAVDGGSIKNAESERYVPIHSKLIADGFLDFVKERGSGPLFYNRTSGDPKRKHASKGLSNRLAAWIRTNGFTDPRKAPNHALRHWFKSEAARIGVPDSVADAIQGHSDGRAATGYRHISLEVMSNAIESMRLPPK
jgi:integrase